MNIDSTVIRAYTSVDLERDLHGYEAADALMREQAAMIRPRNRRHGASVVKPTKVLHHPDPLLDTAEITAEISMRKDKRGRKWSTGNSDRPVDLTKLAGKFKTRRG